MIMPSGWGIGAGVIACAEVATAKAKPATAINLSIGSLPFFLDVLPVWFRGLASLPANAPAGSTASGSSQAFTIHHVHTGAACFADGND